MTDGILSGLRVVELSAFVAAPLAGATLASLGADVIRVEQIGGGIDAFRWPLHEGNSLYRAGLDQGKRSVTVDLRSDAGRAVVRDLVTAPGEDAGIVVTNLSVESWLSYEDLVARRPDLIMLVISGSPEGQAAVDYTVNASVGFPLVTGPEHAVGPVNHVFPAWDVSAALFAATSLLAAERHRRRTGEGQLIRLALSDVALSMADHLGYLAEARLVDAPRERLGNAVYGSYGRDFTSRDGRSVMVCAMTKRQWQALGQATGLEEQFDDLARSVGVDLTLDSERYYHRHAIDALIEPWAAARSLEQIAEKFDAAHVLWSRYRTFKELVAEDPRVQSAFGSPVTFSGFPHPPRQPPTIGADTEQTLSEVLELQPDALADLKRSGAIA